MEGTAFDQTTSSQVQATQCSLFLYVLRGGKWETEHVFAILWSFSFLESIKDYKSCCNQESCDSSPIA